MSKCLHPDTQVLLYLGGMKAAKNVARGDILMGDDNAPRIVLANDSGYDQLYKVIPEIGEPFVVTDAHMLSLFNESTGKITDVALTTYMSKSPLWKIKHKIYSKPVEYPLQSTKNDAYLVGLLLASEKKSIDDIVKEYLSNVLDNLSTNISSNKHARTLDNIDKEEIEYLLNYKYIPDEYLFNTREVRLNLLKGFYEAATYVEKQNVSKPARSLSQPVLKSKPVKRTPSKQGKVSFNMPNLSTHPTSSHTSTSSHRKPKRASSHSHINKKKVTKKKVTKKSPVRRNNLKKFAKELQIKDTAIKHSNTIKPRKSRLNEYRGNVISKKSKSLKVKDKILNEQIKFLIRSLGYECIQIADSLIIQSDLKEEHVPPPMNTMNQASFTIIHHTISNYAGFTLDGNGRFLLSSCVVTHNGL